MQIDADPVPDPAYKFQLYFFPFLVIKVLDPDSLEMLDPDPDPQHCFLLNVFLLYCTFGILPALCCVDPVYSPLKINWNM